MKVIPLSEGSFTIDKSKLFIPFDTSQDDLQQRPVGSLLVEVQPFVVVTPEDVLLLDAGLGFEKDGILQLHKNMMDAGINPSEVTKVLMSHLHKDHAGGVSRKNPSAGQYELAFPQATYYIQRKELDFAFENGAAVRLSATSGAVVTQNKISMSAHKDVQPGTESAGIQVRGTSENNRIEDNHIAGRARVAMAAVHSDFNLDKPNNPDGTPSSGNPRDNAFLENNHTPFKADFADIEVGTGALRTVILARQPLLDDVSGRLETDGAVAHAGLSAAVATAARPSAPPESSLIAGTISDLGTDTKIQGRYELI